VFVLPSLYESFGYVTLEAMALSRPVVATRVAGSRDLVRDGESGLLVEPGDDRALGDAVLRLLSDRALAAKFGAAGAARAEYFTRSRMATAIASLYGHILRS
jgi:glycosyltransferase involved in cell wall biosynthesis